MSLPTNTAGSSLVYHTEINGGGNPLQVDHGMTSTLATSSSGWSYKSVAMTSMRSLVQSKVDTANSSLSYLQHAEDVLLINNDNLTVPYANAQFPLFYTGLDPAVATVVWLEMDYGQTTPTALAATSQIANTLTTLSSLSAPGKPGILCCIGVAERSSAIANCQYGDYNTTTGTVAWSAAEGTISLEMLNGKVTLVSTSGLPSGWNFSDPQMQSDGSWKLVLTTDAASTNDLSDLTVDKSSIVNNGTDAATLTATVKDSASRQTVAGATVSWSTTSGSLNVSSSVTDSNGQTQAQLTSSQSPGTVTVTASVADSSKDLNITIASAPAGLTLCSDLSYQGTQATLAEHGNTVLRDSLYFWNWKSMQSGSERLMMYTPMLDLTSFDFQTYRNDYFTADVPDLTLDYQIALSAPSVVGVCLGENDVVIRFQLLSDNKNQKLAACATQSWPNPMQTASVFNGAASVDGILVVMDKTQGISVIPLQVGSMGDDGLVSWIFTTSLIASWDEVNQQPVVLLGNDAPQGWRLYPCQPTANAGEFKTTLSGIQSNNFDMYCVTNAPTTKLQSNAYSLVAFYGNPGQSITVQASGSATISSTNPVVLDSTGYGRVQITDVVAEEVTVTAQCASYQQTGTLTFVSKYSSVPYYSYQLTQGAPADGKTPNLIYCNYVDYSIHVSGNALFANGTHDYPVNYKSNDVIEVFDAYPETVTASENSSSRLIGNITFQALKG